MLVVILEKLFVGIIRGEGNFPHRAFVFAASRSPGGIASAELLKVEAWGTLGHPGQQNQAVILAGWSTPGLTLNLAYWGDRGLPLDFPLGAGWRHIDPKRPSEGQPHPPLVGRGPREESSFS